jgi:RNA polymerase sigma factor (sigma-70 family)
VWSQAFHIGRRHGLDVNELFQEGFIVLAESLRSFDYTIGRFSTYAFPRVRGRLLRLSSSKMGRLNLPPFTARLRAKLLTTLPHGSTEEDWEQLLGAQWRKQAHLLEYQPPMLIGIENLTEQSFPSDDIGDSETAELVELGLNALSGLEKTVISLRFGLDGGLPLTHQETADHLKTSATNVRRIEKRALAAMRKAIAET